MKQRYNERRKTLAESAQKHTEEMAEKYKEEIQNSVANTVIFRDIPQESPNEENLKNSEKTIISHILLNMSFKEAIFSKDIKDAAAEGKRIAVLNFASFKNPGSGFLEGSIKQEAMLCRASFLYNVLKEHYNDYYIPNQRNTYKCLYKDVGMYSKDIKFFNDDEIMTIDVITCSPPNKNAARKYNDVLILTNNQALEKRILFIKHICKEMKVDILIAGAFGCGAFGQNPDTVSNYFINKFHYKTKEDTLEKIYYAVPGYGNRWNYSVFSCNINFTNSPLYKEKRNET